MTESKPNELAMLRRYQFFSKLLAMPSYGSMEILLRDAGDVGLDFRKPFHRIIVAEMELWEDFISRKDTQFDPEARGEMMFLLSNVCYDLFSAEGRCDVVSVDFQGRLVFWLDAEDDTVTTEYFQRMADRAAKLLESEYRLFVTFSISTWFSDLQMPFAIYRDTLNVLFYHRYLSGKESAYVMTELPTTEAPVPLSKRSSQERQLLSLLENREFDRLLVKLNEIYRIRFFEEQTPLVLFPQRRAAFTELLELTVNEAYLQYPQTEREMRAAIHRIALDETAAGQLEAVEQYFQSLVPSEEQAPAWVAWLKTYVDTHYSDPSITVYSLAEMVGVTSSYCTRVFSRHVGMSLLAYVQRKRVQAAIEWMDAGCTMTEVARRTGFTCTQTLRRNLKNYLRETE